jgi:hypothetical protein
MSTLNHWAIRWAVPAAALHDLRRQMGVVTDPVAAPPTKAISEAALSNRVRIEASQKGMRLFRNNVGALQDARGVPVRYGLANDSAALNKLVKSADLIGWDAEGRFLSVEVKEPGWSFTGTVRELAQQKWAELVLAAGGRALFVNKEGML